MDEPTKSPTPVVLATLNARYHHASLALRTLKANLGPWRDQTAIIEFTNSESAADIVEKIDSYNARIIGFSVYIWNVEPLTHVVALLKRLRPDVVIVLGGPEVSHETNDQAIVALADHVIQGEGEDALRSLVTAYLEMGQSPARIIHGGQPDLETIALPYELYDAEDIAHRTIYVEASRGCPYKCEFCLSSLDLRVRHFPLDRLLAAFEDLIARGARHFKFIDRTFNLKLDISARILEFFLARHQDGMLYHFEMVPDRLPEGLRDIITRFPPAALQFEVGVQTLDPEVGQRISRRQDVVKMRDNLAFLRDSTGVHVHADLIIGLPGETLASFADGVNTLFAMGSQEIQVGILKRLRGAPIARHEVPFGLIFDPNPPYEILATSTIDFNTMQHMKRFAFVWDRLLSRGNLPTAAPLLYPDGAPFYPVLAFSEWLHAAEGRVHAISLDRLAAALSGYLTTVAGLERSVVGEALAKDYALTGRKLPAALRPDSGAKASPTTSHDAAPHRARQARYLASGTAS